jgi:hypothetical protein
VRRLLVATTVLQWTVRGSEVSWGLRRERGVREAGKSKKKGAARRRREVAAVFG